MLGRPAPWRPTRDGGTAIVGVCGPPDGRAFAGIANLDELATSPRVDLVRETGAPGARVHNPPRSNADFVAWVVTSAPTARRALAQAYQAVVKAQFR